MYDLETNLLKQQTLLLTGKTKEKKEEIEKETEIYLDKIDKILNK